ncbi:MAG TPA: T9SS type A sorting domain-containing protein [Chitinophagaceae bacterium]|nr:T9SS type A sorting domain-containing protein [Chitinophagaceae bacterium]
MRLIYTLSFLLLLTLQVESRDQNSLPVNPAGTIRCYPNPAVTQITFDFQGSYDKSYSFQIYSFIGKKVFDLPSLSVPKTTVDLADFLRGIYIFQLKDKNGKIVESGRFQVSK